MHRNLVLALLLTIPLLAGCADSGGSGDGTGVDGGGSGGGTTLAAGTGAIDGLLVDDRFRPIDLEDRPDTEFQTTGFVLLQETGQQAQTNDNGEFAFVNVRPGTYTLRVTAAGHEATPRTVQVVAGEFAEAQIIARRVASDSATIITQEYTVFIACSLAIVLPVTLNDCDLDLSGDSNRWSFDADYTAVDEASALVIEMLANAEAQYEVDVWWVPDDLVEDAQWYASHIFAGTYTKMVLRHGEANEEHADYAANSVWNNDHPFQTDLYIFGELSQEGADATDNYLVGGVGLHLGTKAKFLHSLFVGEPEVDIDSYCLLC